MPTFRYHKTEFMEIRNARRLRKVRRAALALTGLLLAGTVLLLMGRFGHWPTLPGAK